MTKMLDELELMSNSEDQYKHCYAAFGLAAYLAQVLEQEIENIWVKICYLDGEAAKHRTWDNFEATFSRTTMGRMWKLLSPKLLPSEELKCLVGEAIDSRNSLIHGYWYKNIPRIGSIEGRRWICRDLDRRIELFKSADSALEAYAAALRRKVGISDEKIAEEWSRMLKEFGWEDE